MNVKAEFALRILRREVNLALRRVDPLGGDDEMVDQLLHRHQHPLLRREHAFRIRQVDRARWHRVEHLSADADRLAHFFHTDLVAGVAIALVCDRHVEIVFFVAEIRAVLAEIAVDARGTEVRPGHPEGNGRLPRDHAYVDHPVAENFIIVQQLGDLAEGDRALIKEGADRLIEADRHVAKLAADAGVGGGETGTGELLAEIVNLFPLGKCVEENSHRADIHCADADPQHVG